jgi:UDP-N-acetylmuramoyl-L-alanyl-D-glutamate--2,6-diaminopimelate ligase
MNPKKLVRKVLPKRGIKVAEEAYRKGRVYAFQAAKGFPAKNLRVIAVTGTDGKTSTCLFINEMLKSAGYRTAMFTTAVIEIDGKATPNKTHRTVVLTAELVSLLQKAKKANLDFVVLEVTSMALHQHKLIGIPIEVAVMTNLTPEHLDYHKTMEHYAAAKARLFNNYMKPKHVVLNRDDEWYDFFRGRAVGQVMSYGEHKDSTSRISNVATSDTGSTWTLTAQNNKYALKTSMPGKFNVLNATAAACAGLAVGMTPEQLVRGVAALKVVPGRMELVDAGQPFTVLVDYAVTAEALHNVLTAARGMVKGRVISVFGATGDRDKAKRPVMGQVAAKDADYVFLTDDETYTEDPDTIRAAVRAGLESAKGKFIEVADRREAIKQAFAYAKKGDIVVLTGIGHQDSRNMGGKLIPWDERQVARELLRFKG